MLVLSRKIQETIVIDRRISITVLRIQGSAVRIGVEAPADVRIIRAELLERLTTREKAMPDAA
jgi:carbon storage regulator